jgi:hypothetical protein
VREAEGYGLRIHDLLEGFQREDPPLSGYSLDVWHLDREGHRVVAEGVLGVLVQPNGRFDDPRPRTDREKE